MPQLNSGAGPSPEPEVSRANRQLAGNPCPACSQEVLLGQEVVRCPDCQAVIHRECWQAGGCPVCAGASSEGGAEAARTKVCPSCAETIPGGAVICPYCGERVGQAGVLPPGIPWEFVGKKGFLATKWQFTVRPDELVGTRGARGEAIRVPRQQAAAQIEMNGRRLIIKTPETTYKFAIDDAGRMALESWLTGELVRKTSLQARDSLVEAIVGIFCFGFILGPVAAVHGLAARKMIRRYPEALSGSGLALAGIIIGFMDLILNLVGLFARIAPRL